MRWLTTGLLLSGAALLLWGTVGPPRACASPLVVDAGPAKVLALPAQDLTLFGHVTDTVPFTSQWSQVSGPAAVRFSAAHALATTVTFTTPGPYVFQLAARDSTATVTSTVQVTVLPASRQTAFYVDPTYTGTFSDGSAAHPWTSLLDSDSDYAVKWTTINRALATNHVIIYFSARTATADTAERFVPPTGASLFVNRGCRAGTRNCPSGADTTGSHRLTLDGMSLYNTNDATPHWVAYTGTHKFKIDCVNTCGSLSIGWDDDTPRDYITLRGFEVTGPGSRIVWGGNYSYLEYMWVHDVTVVGATVQFSAAVTDYPDCQDLGKKHDITVRNNLIERGYDEGLYIAGTYNYPTYGGCPAYGNTHWDILIESNTIRDPGANGGEGDGIDLKMGLMNVTVRNNLITNPINACEGGAITSEGVFPPAQTNYLIEGNRISGGTDLVGCNFSGGVQLGGQNGTVLRNNVIYNTPGYAAGINLEGDPTFPNYAIQVYNNTVYGNAGGGVGLGDTHGVTLRNNLLVGNGTGSQIGGYSATGIDSDYNLLAPTGSDFAEGRHSLLLTTTQGIVVQPATGDFHLVPGSPARGTGVDLSATGFAMDVDGTVRSPGAAWDIGAYAFELPGIALTLNQPTFRPGDPLTLTATVYPGEPSRRVDAYVAIRLPDQTLWFLQGDGSVTPTVQPLLPNWPVAAFREDLFHYTFGGSEPVGRYTWLAAFTEPGTTQVIGLIAQAAFMFSP